MAISLSCPSCEKTLKVKDELAGRKVKCPSCGSGIAVPAEEEATAPEEEERPRKKKRETEDDEQPRKKKKKKKSNMGLWIAVGGGAAFMLLLLCGGIGAFFYFRKTPEPAKTDQAKAKQKEKEEQKEEPKVEQPRTKNVVVRGMELQELRNMMKQVGLAYHNYCLTNNRAPTKWQDLSPYYEKIAKYDQMLADGTVVFIWNARPQDMTQGTTQTVIAYEKDAGNNGLRVCLFGDGAVDMLDEEQFKTAPKAQPRK